MTNSNQPSVAILTNAPAPYRIPFFNELSKRCRLLLLFDSLREPGREWDIDTADLEFEWVVTRALPMSGRIVRRGASERWIPRVPIDAISVLNQFQPDVVVSSEFGVRTASAAMFCRLRKRPLIVWWEGTQYSERSVRPHRILLRKSLSRYATRAWGNGDQSAKSLADYGIADSQIDLGMTGMGTQRWRTEVEDARGAPRAAIHDRLGLSGVVLLFAGGLTNRKGVSELLSALTHLVEADLPAWSVLFVGSGPRAKDIELWARLHPAVPVASTGFIQPSELARYFAAGDVFVMPSIEDVWGVVCLEALVAGLPQVTSSLAGASTAIVTSTEIGDIIDPRDTQSLASALARRIRLGRQRVPEADRDRAMLEWSTAAMAERALRSIRASI